MQGQQKLTSLGFFLVQIQTDYSLFAELLIHAGLLIFVKRGPFLLMSNVLLQCAL